MSRRSPAQRPRGVAVTPINSVAAGGVKAGRGPRRGVAGYFQQPLEGTGVCDPWSSIDSVRQAALSLVCEPIAVAVAV